MIVISDTELENALKQLLQKNLRFWLNKRVWKEGKLLLFKQSGFYLELIINSKKKAKERFEIPIPYNVESWLDEDVVYFDYKLLSLSGKKQLDIYTLLTKMECIGKNKFFDTILEIEVLPPI